MNDVTAIAKSMYFDGTPVDDRFRLIIDGKIKKIEVRLFRILVYLALQRINHNNQPWVSKCILEPSGNASRYMYCIRRDYPTLDIENDRHGNYRLLMDPANISFNIGKMQQFPQADIQQLFNDDGVNQL